MSIVIQNISDNFDLAGEQTYLIRINKQQIITFKHIRKDGLAVCLRKASEAVELIEGKNETPKTI